MLRKFEVKNFKNFNDWFIFDLSDIKSYAFNPECVENGIVSKSIVYGPNGCGKTNLGRAIFDIKTHLTDEKIDDTYSNNYLNAASGEELAEFRYIFQFGDNTLEYTYGKKSVSKLVYETVAINQKKVISLDRRESSIAMVDLAGAETLNTDLSDSNLSVVKYVRSNAILADDAVNSTLKHFLLFVQFMLIEQSVHAHLKVMRSENTQFISRKFIKEPGCLKKFEEFLNVAGVKCKLTTMDVNGEETIALDFDREKINFFSVASTGTRSLTELYLYFIWLESNIEHCKNDPEVRPFIFIDEFDAFYHHAVSKLIVKQLRDEKCQAVFTTHNTSIMSNDLLRPDCYFIMNETDIKPMYRFTEKELRKAHNIEKMYKAGAFDG